MAEEKSITSMAITVVIALVVTCTVLFPVINSVNDGGNGGGGDSDITGAYQYGSMSVGLDDVTSFIENPPELRIESNDEGTEHSVISNGNTITTFTLNMDGTGGENVLLPLAYVDTTAHLSPEMASQMGGADIIETVAWTYLSITYSEGESEQSGTAQYGVYPYGHIITVQKSNLKYEGNTVTGSSYADMNELEDCDIFNAIIGGGVATPDFISKLSDLEMEIIYIQESGEYAYVEGIDFNDISSDVIVMGFNEDTRWETSADWDRWYVTLGYAGSVSGLSSDSVTYATGISETGHLNGSAPLNISVSESIECTVNFEDDHVSSFSIDSAMVPVSAIEGGGSSDNGDLGVAGTILAVVPIFVVLGILMYAVQYFRDPRKL